MKNIALIILGPVIRRIGPVGAGAVTGMIALEPELASRVETWLSAGAFLIADVIASHIRRQSKEAA